MTRLENHCCDCAVPGYPCRGDACPLTHVAVSYCDKCDPNCNHPLDEIYDVDDEELCKECLLDKFLRK